MLGLALLKIPVSDLSQSVSFYEQALGLQAAYRGFRANSASYS